MTRTAPDSCPGVLRLHQAADGPLARIRVPGGLLTSDQVLVLAAAASELGEGAIELTSRGNLQLRQVRDAAELTARLTGAGLLPSRTHERVRNIVASPLSGRVGGLADVRGLVGELDARLCATPRLADLPGRVLFTLDDGRGDVSVLDGDIGVHAVDPDEFALLLAGVDTGVRVTGAEAVDLALAAAEEFLAVSSRQWRLHEVADGPARILDSLGLTPGTQRVEVAAAQDVPIGWLDQDDGLVALGAGVRLGALDARLAEFVAAVERPVIVTPWRSLVIADLEEWAAEQVVRVLAPMGLIFDAASPWLHVSACAGQPGCAKSLTDVRADVTAAVESGRVLSEDASTETAPERVVPAEEVSVAGRQHWSGCERRCGRPRGEVTDVVATPDGYRVD
ncbi:precorrin-3B synthase [Nocardia amikacinitolerans]|uniref:precorrin-3B synthase n=1 Tax=Nocardia amikacinitolerans TaxID=756689 RepID=UPI0020A36342|nr:precorrin-3B synthase [Nocardia amikacinitolerans]MCP2277969.1 precorrin-3B synthase [Nocardia amikacinitolerans]MCP2297693.1 precorrin-3B synthase [Nocardia amikacinitolerans]